MAVSEPRRLALHQAARDALGEEEGDTLMALSPPANTDVATMQALELVEQRLQSFTWKVVVGTAVLLYLAMAGTMFGGAAVLLQLLERT